MKRVISITLMVMVCFALVPVEPSYGQVKMGASDLTTAIPFHRIIKPAWLAAKDFGGIAYFIYASPNKLRRYNMDTGAWLADLTLSQAPTALYVDSSGLYIAFSSSLSRRNLDGSAETFVYSNDFGISSLMATDQFFFLFSPDRLKSINRQTWTAISSFDYIEMGQQPYLNSAAHTIIYLSCCVGSSYTNAVFYGQDGSLGPKFGGQSGPQGHQGGIYLLPDQKWVVDNYGNVFFAADLTYKNSLTIFPDDMTSYGSQIIFVSNGGLFSYTSDLMPIAHIYPLVPSQKVFAHGNMIFSFFERSDSIHVDIIPATTLKLTGQSTRLSPNQLSFWPELFSMDKDGILYMYSRDQLTIFRWSTPEHKYLAPILLNAPLLNMVYSKANNTLYLAYRIGSAGGNHISKITQINLDVSLDEEPFQSGSEITDLLQIGTAGDYLAVIVASSYSVKWYAYNSGGEKVSETQNAGVPLFPDEMAWNDTNRKMYFLSHITQGYYLVSLQMDPAGQFNGFQYCDCYQSQPLRVAPDGSVVITGEGTIRDAGTFDNLGSLGSSHLDAVWSGGVLYTAESVADGGYRIWKWDSAYQHAGSTLISGDTIRIFAIGGGLLAVSHVGGGPYFTILSNDLTSLFTTQRNTLNLPMVTTTGQGGTDFTDDFTNPASGWFVGDDSTGSFGYASGEYSIRSGQAWTMVGVASPAARAENYTFSVDGRFMDNYPAILGVIVDVIGDFDQFYLYGISIEGNCVSYVFDGVHLMPGMNFMCGVHPGNNHFEVDRSDYQELIKLNNNVIATIYNDYLFSYPSRVGLFMVPTDDHPYSEARFSNFHLHIDPGIMVPLLR